MKDTLPAEWRIGVLFSRSGITSVTETDHFDGTMLAIEEINAAGGIFGRPLVPVCKDPGASDAGYRSLARQMLADDEIDVIFGCSMSASRKAVLPIVERYDGLLFYPSMYEGFEYSENVIYSGATANQICPPLADYLIRNHGGRIFFIGSDYIYPRETNRVMRELIDARGGKAVGEVYLPLGAGAKAFEPVVETILREKPDAVFSTAIGISGQALYTLYDAAGIDRSAHPIASLTFAESEIARVGAAKCTGHILAGTYFETLDTPANARFTALWQSRFGAGRRLNTYAEPAYLQVHLFARALARVGAMDPKAIARAVLDDAFEAPEGPVRVDPETRHLWLTPRIGVARGDGLFDLVWQGRGPVRPDPWLATTRFEEPALDAWA